jgi:two-component system NarL family sensor kinase
MKLIILALISLGLATYLVAQPKLDSLEIKIKNAKNPNETIKIYEKYGLEYSNSGKFDKSIFCFNEVIKLAIKVNNSDIKASAYNEIGNAYADLGNNLEALKNYQNCLKNINESDFSLNARVHKNIGALFLSWKKFDQALNYYNQAQIFADKAGDKITAADCLNNKGTVYEQQHKFDAANKVYNTALQVYISQNKNDRICLTYNNLAILNKVQGKSTAATQFYQKAIEFAKKAQNKWITAALTNNYGNLLSETGNFNQSEKELLDALKLSKEIGAKQLIYESLENLSLNAEREKDFKKAYQYHQQFYTANKDFINIENTQEVSRLQEQFEAVSKQKKIEGLNKQNTIQQLSIANKNKTIFIIMGVFIVMGIISFLLFNRNKLSQAAKIQDEKLRISRELHDNIGSQLTFISNSIESFETENGLNGKLQEAHKITKNTIQELRRTVWLINQSEFSLEEFVIKLRDYVKPLETGKPIIIIHADNPEDCIFKPIMATNLFRIIQECVNNSLKYAHASLLEITFKCEVNKLHLIIADNGKGFDPKIVSDGYGLKNIKARVEILKGIYTLETEAKKGTKINIFINI